ncbi:hypothetical protein QTO34_007817 [Cnephaeus nilssonii]|uniref:DNA-dependent protein kinase catalytic subunit n=1 Tax=Cnephaeus nilssonii TaxID=3371016 RepID=A0AA40LFZ7_CNENI|nr:hypothetical protein QTO34_007817 [Eptesicus nilssonii]
MDMLLAALECYNTFIEERTLEASEVLENIAMHDTMAAMKRFGPGITDNRLSPQEEERYNYSKCTIVVRIMEFTTTLLRIYPEGWKVGFEELCGIDLYGPDAYVDRAKLSSFVSTCKHLHRAGVLHDVLPSQGQAIILLPFFTNLTGGSLEDLKHVLEKIIISNFPMKSEEFAPGTLQYNNYVDFMKKGPPDGSIPRSIQGQGLKLLFEAWALVRDPQLAPITAGDPSWFQWPSSTPSQCRKPLAEARALDRDPQLAPIACRGPQLALITCGGPPLAPIFPSDLRLQYPSSNNCSPRLQPSWLGVFAYSLSDWPVGVAGGRGLLCYDAFIENMAGETQLLERRRLYHCAAYNCAISLICCVFNELKFYQGFLFSEKPEKNLLIFENLIDLNRCYTFPVEVEVPMERKKKYIEIRKEAREAANGDSDSSLSEEMSQFDFSTGVQSYSYSSRDPKSTIGHFRRQEHKDPTIQDDILELEMDELNQHECMAAMTALIKHMQRNQILPKAEEILEESVCELIVKQLKQHQNTMEDKFIVCLNKAVKNFPPLADRFMSTVFFLLPKFHGVMKTLCLEVVLCRSEAITDLYLQLKSKDFIQVMRHSSRACGFHEIWIVTFESEKKGWWGLVILPPLTWHLVEATQSLSKALFQCKMHGVEFLYLSCQPLRELCSNVGSPTKNEENGAPEKSIEKPHEKPEARTNGRSSFNWLTGSSIDPLVDYTASSSSDSLSSSLLFAHKRSEKLKTAPSKSVGPDFGKKRLALPGDTVDNAPKGTDSRVDILRLRRRFLKDQEKISLIYAKKGIAEQKRKKRDPIIAKQLFGSLFSAIIKEMDKYKTIAEKNNVTQKLLQDFNHFLSTTYSFFPPFVACIQEISCQHADLLSLDPASVGAGCLASLQQPVGIRLLEEALLHLAPQEPPPKRARGRPRLSPDVLRWMELAKCFFLSKIEEKLTLPDDHSMDMDGDADSSDRMEGREQEEDICSLVKSCENTSSYLSKNILAFRDHNVLLGTTYRIIANALSSEPSCLAEIEESKARRILELSGSTSENVEKVVTALHQRAFHHLSEATRTAEEETPSGRGPQPAAGVVDAYMALVDFCDQRLREEEETASVTESVELQTYPALVVDKMLKALKLHSNEARLKFPRLLQIIEQYPEETLSLMTKEISSIPCWQFIGWISHMLALLDKEEAVAIQHTVEEIADHYPQAIVYPFIISSESYFFRDTSTGHKNKEFVASATLATSTLRAGGFQSVTGYQAVTGGCRRRTPAPIGLPQFLVDDDSIRVMKVTFNKMDSLVILTVKAALKIRDSHFYSVAVASLPSQVQCVNTVVGSYVTADVSLTPPWSEQLAFGKEFDKHFGRGGSKLPGMKLHDFNDITNTLLLKMRDDSKPPGNLKECSPWMSDFRVEFLRNELEIPGQYDGKGKPMSEYHARIAGFDERVKTMASIRKPKRIIIRGHDERDYPFLVKGGEDLRQDQRIEQLFGVMNVILSRDAACSQRNMQLQTYHVIPMTSRLGLIEWIENTFTLKELLLSNMSQEEKAAYTSDPRAPPFDYRDWLAKTSGKRGAGAYMLMYKRAFLKMSTGPEAFLALRSHFASSHALLCVSHWILGIGDRHLNNFMVNMETGGMIGIDFGHAFGSATQFLPVPELMPFRLTRQFINLMSPMKETGVVYSVMVHALRAFRSHPDLLTTTMDVFVKEPSFDWKNFEQKMLKKGGSWIREINVTEKNWYPRQKIYYAKRKLTGANPAVITCDELRLGHEKEPAFDDFVAVARGNKDHNIRAQEPESGLSEEAQVKCLIDQATDPNILGRTWEGKAGAAAASSAFRSLMSPPSARPGWRKPASSGTPLRSCGPTAARLLPREPRRPARPRCLVSRGLQTPARCPRGPSVPQHSHGADAELSVLPAQSPPGHPESSPPAPPAGPIVGVAE